MTVSRFLMQEREWPGYGEKQKALQKLAEAGFTDPTSRWFQATF